MMIVLRNVTLMFKEIGKTKETYKIVLHDYAQESAINYPRQVARSRNNDTIGNHLANY